VDVRRSILVAVFLAGVGAVLSGALWQLGSRSDPADADATAASSRSDELRALAILRAWDSRRAEAWAGGDLRALGRLYVPGSDTGAVDRAMLRSYLDRGLVVEGMHTQVLAADLRAYGERRLVLQVTDRLAAAVAVGDGARLPLPRDRATSRTVWLVRQDAGWVVREAR